MMNGHSVKLKGIGTFRHKVSAAMVDKEALAGESLVRDVRVQFMPERTVTAVGKQRIKRRALIPGNLTWKIYDKPSKPHKTTEEGEAEGLALGCVEVVDLGLFGGELSGFSALFDFTHRCSIPFQGSPRKEKMIWSCLGERSLRWGSRRFWRVRPSMAHWCGFHGRGVFLRSPCCGRGSRPWQGLA